MSSINVVQYVIRSLVKHFGLKHADLAVLMGASLARVKQLACGRIKNLDRAESLLLVQKLGVSAEWLISGHGPMLREAPPPSDVLDLMRDLIGQWNRREGQDLLVADRNLQEELLLLYGRAHGFEAHHWMCLLSFAHLTFGQEPSLAAEPIAVYMPKPRPSETPEERRERHLRRLRQVLAGGDAAPQETPELPSADPGVTEQ